MIYDESDKPLEKEGEEKAENVDDLLNPLTEGAL